ncbi:MAG: glycosyltransferase 87 family protein [Armatimonadia bacterium]
MAVAQTGTRLWRVLGWLVVGGAAMANLLNVALRPDAFQWDLKPFYYAERAFAQGLDPYTLDSLHTAGAEPSMLFAFRYPLATLALWWPLAGLDYVTAYYLWLAAKLGALVALIWLWRKHFVPEVDPLLLGALLVFGFNGALCEDLRAGNKIPFEQLAIWAGLVCFLRGRYAWFAVLVALAAVFNLLPALLLGLLLFVPGRLSCRLGAMGLGLAVLAILVLGPYARYPELLPSYLGSISGVREVGSINPCALALLDDLPERFGRAQFLVRTPWLIPAIWGVYFAAIVGFGLRALRRFANRGDRYGLVMVALITYALAVPRFKDYAYVLLLLPALWAIRSLPRAETYPVLAGLAVGYPGPHNLGVSRTVGKLISAYWSWLLVLGMWLAVVTGAIAPAEPETASEEVPS